MNVTEWISFYSLEIVLHVGMSSLGLILPLLKPLFEERIGVFVSSFRTSIFLLMRRSALSTHAEI